MISFIKKLFGFKSTQTAPTVAPYKIEPKPTTTHNEKVKPAIKSETEAVPAKKNRRPRNRNRVKAGTTGSKPTQGVVKTHQTSAKVAPIKSTKPKNSEKSK